MAFEDILKYYVEYQNITAATLKLSAVYGPRDNQRKLITYLISCSLEGAEAKVSPGEQEWDYVYVRDVAKAYLKTVDYLIDTSKNYSVFNIGSGSAYRIKDIVKNVKSLNYKLKVKLGAIPYNKHETFYFKMDITEARNKLKWKPAYSLKDGIRETYEYLKNDRKFKQS